MPKPKKNPKPPAEEGCMVFGLHRNVIKSVQNQMPQTEEIEDLSEFYKLFGDKTRLGIIWALSVSEICVCDLSVLLTMSQSAISHQLRILKQARIVKSRREGKVAYYSLEDDHIRSVLNVGHIHMKEHT